MREVRERAPFRFKRFAVSHTRSSMPVGVDAVLIGSWAGLCDADGDCLSPRTILDVGCGCGVISLMCAQRFDTAKVIGLDIDEDSVLEAEANFQNSPYADRLEVVLSDVNRFARDHIGLFDLIISNPPYFDSGVITPSSSRERARHQNTLSPLTLMRLSTLMLKSGGRLAMITPTECLSDILDNLSECSLELERATVVRGNSLSAPKRVMTQFVKRDMSESEPAHDVGSRVAEWERIISGVPLTIEYERGAYTEQYIELTKEFYLKF